MSSVTYPRDMNVNNVVNTLKKSAKSRSDFQLTDSTFTKGVLWLGGMLTTNNARFYNVERHNINSCSGQVTVKSESLEMVFADTCIPTRIFKKLRAECYWRQHPNVWEYIERIIRLRDKGSARLKKLSALTAGDYIQYNNRTYQLVENIGADGWRVRDIEDGQTYRMSQYRFKQALPLRR